MLAAILRRIALPFLNTSEVRSTRFRPIYRQLFWLFVVTCIILGWIGQKVVEYPYIQVGQRASLYYFRFLVVLVPRVGRRESTLIRVDTKERK